MDESTKPYTKERSQAQKIAQYDPMFHSGIGKTIGRGLNDCWGPVAEGNH